LDKPPPRLQVPRHGPRLDQCLTLPPLGPVPVVRDRSAQRQREVHITATGAEPQIDPEDLALRSRTGDEAGDLRRQTREELFVRQRAGPRGVGPRRLTVARVQIQQVDVAAVVELLTSELAERDD